MKNAVPASPASRRQRAATARPPFASLISDHGGSVYRFLVTVAGPDRAEDCWQETFLAALEGYPGLQDPSTVRSWLFTIAYRKAIDAGRRAARTLPVADPPESGIETVTQEGLWARVRELPPKQRIAVAYRFVADLAYREIAHAMGTTEEAARRNVLEGLRALRVTARDFAPR